MEGRKKICQKSYKLSLAYKVENSTFQFGYEVSIYLKKILYLENLIFFLIHKKYFFQIYYNHVDGSQFGDHYNPQDYQSPNKVIESLKTIFSTGIYQAKQFIRIRGSAKGIGVKQLWLNGEIMVNI